MRLNRSYRYFQRFVAPKRRTSARPLYRLFQVALLIVVCALIFNIINIKKLTPGEWGDFFGGFVNPLLTFLTFMGLLITIFVQQTELRESRAEMKRSADALVEQSKSLKRQNFESTFFQMLTIHNTIVNSIDLVDKEGKTFKGRDCFSIFYTRLNKIYRANKDKAQGRYDERNVINLSYQLFWKQHQTELGHYFRYLYNLVRLVKDEGFQAGPYLRLVRAQLSDQELLLLFYNCISDNGGNFTPLVEEFNLLNNMPRIRLLDKKHENFIAPAAFTNDSAP